MRLSLGLLLLLGLCLGLGVTMRSAYASTIITVSTCDESHLDAAIAQANSDNAGDTITFSCSGDIPLTSTLTISGSMTLDGSGQSVTLDGSHHVQVLQVLSSGHLTLKALTFANGQATSSNDNTGGGISNAGTLTITKSTLSGNAASFEGGGIFNTGMVSITKSTLNGDSAEVGGGIYNNGGKLTLSNSTLNGNSANDGGGIFNNVGTVSISNSTLSGNAAHGDGGGTFNSGMVSISNSTLSGNAALNDGGGIFTESGTVSSRGSIVAENSASQGNDCFGPITNKGYNLESGTDCGFIGKGSLRNVSNAQLALSALANNGGPTQTMALQQGSVAIDRIPKVKCPATDQRGEPRPDAGENKCDMGAYESNH